MHNTHGLTRRRLMAAAVVALVGAPRLAPGVMPVGMVKGRAYMEGLAPWVIAADGEDVPEIAGTAEGDLDVEAITAARPDLILTSWPDETTYQTLFSIAPTLVFKSSDATTWQDVQRPAGGAAWRLYAALAGDGPGAVYRVGAQHPVGRAPPG